LFISFILLRLYFIFTFPPFTDESLYIRWGQIMVHNDFFRWASLPYINRQPLAFWIFGIGAIMFRHPLIGARMMVLLSNIPVFFLLFRWIQKRYSEKTALYALVILTWCPLFILTQSLALMDGLLFALTGVIIFSLDRIEKTMTIWFILLISVCIGIGLWIKTTTLLILAMTCLSLLMTHKKEHTIYGLLLSYVLCIIVPLVLLIPLMLRPDFKLLFNEPSSFLISANTPIADIVGFWVTNLGSTVISTLIYFGPVVFMLFVFARKLPKNPHTTISALWFLIPAFLMMLSAHNFRYRYFVFGSVGLLPAFSSGLQRTSDVLKNSWIRTVLVSTVIIYGIVFTVSPVTVFSLFPKWSGERDYAFSWPSGYGIPGLISWLDARIPNDMPALLAVVDSPGNPSDYLLAYYYFRPNVRVIFITVSSEKELLKMMPLTLKQPVYVATRASLIPENLTQYFRTITLFPKPNNEDAVGIYQLTL